MRRGLYIASLLTTVALSAAAQPEVSWLERQHDFGVFWEKDGKVSCQMRLVNTGNEPLVIVKTQVGCGCTDITYPQDPILPGDTAAVSISYNPSGRPGQFTKEALIVTNTTPKRSMLEISGHVIPTEATLNRQYPLQAGSLRISQENMPFGELVRGKSKVLFLSAYNASTDTLLVHVTGKKKHLAPAVVPDTVPPAMVTALTVHYATREAPLWGLNVDTLTLSCEPMGHPSDAVAGTADVRVTAQVLENFDGLSDKQRSDAPVVGVECGDRLDFGTMTAGETVTRSFTITNKGKNPLAIRRLWAPEGEGITATADRLEIKRGKKATVSVTVDTSCQQGDLLNVPLTVMSNDPYAPVTTVRLVGIIDK